MKTIAQAPVLNAAFWSAPLAAETLNGLRTMDECGSIAGDAEIGAPRMRCSTCHRVEDLLFSTGQGSPPDQTPWRLAPTEMRWGGKSAADHWHNCRTPR